MHTLREFFNLRVTLNSHEYQNAKLWLSDDQRISDEPMRSAESLSYKNKCNSSCAIYHASQCFQGSSSNVV